jgi:hypothetical protein
MMVVQYRTGWNGDGENRREDPGADQIAEIHRHRYRVPAGLSQRRGQDLDDPERQRDLRNLADGVLLEHD